MQAIERETVITFNDDESKATVYSCQRPIWTKMEKLGVEPTKTFRQGGLPIAYQYEVPKRWIKISKTRVVSEEHREKARINMTKLRKSQLSQKSL